MRLKLSDENDSSFRCCFSCCHVRTGTMTFGILQMICQVFVLFTMVLAVVNPNFNLQLQSVDNTEFSIGDVNVTKYDGTLVQFTHEETTGSRCAGFAVGLFSVLLAIMMVYGVLRRKANFLLPHFILQVFDFTLTCLSVIGYFTYAPNMKTFIASKVADPALRQQVMAMDEPSLALIVMITMVFVLFLKAYLVGMVWSCYKFLVQYTAQLTTNEVEQDSQMLLPPKYEEIYESGSGAAVPIPAENDGLAPPAYSA